MLILRAAQNLRIVTARLKYNLHYSQGKRKLLQGQTKVGDDRRVDDYHSILEDAYAAYSKIETRVDELGQELEAEHARLDEGVKKYG